MNKPSRFYQYLAVSVLFLVLGFNFIGASETLHVCELNCEYGSIERALGDSEPGDLIRVQNGNYEENLVIDKDVTITGTSSRWVRISPDRNDRPTVEVGPSSASVTLKDLTISAGEENGPAVLATGEASLNLEKSSIRGSGRGLRTRDSAIVKLSEVEIRGNREALTAEGSSEVVIHDGLITETGSGLIVANNSELTVISTEISDCNKAGILGSDTAKINVLSSTITDNEGAGVKLTNFFRLNMRESQVKGNNGGGILLRNSAKVRLTENEITYNDNVNLAIISKECGFSGPIEGFFGKVEGTDNEIVPADSGFICPERFNRVTTNEGGGYSYPFKPSTYAFVGLIGAASLIFFLSRF